jgi:hypothetical protein
MANKVIEEKFVREADEPDSRQISDNSLSDQNKRRSGFEDLFDVKVVVSVAGAFAFLIGWIYNIAFFSVLNYDYMDLLTVNDYVLSTLSALPPLLFMGAISFLIGTISTKIQRAAATPYRVASRFTSNPSTIAMFAWIAFLLVSSVPGLISYGFRGYWESLMFVGMGVAASTLVFSVVLRIDIIYFLRGWLLSVGIWLFFFHRS